MDRARHIAILVVFFWRLIFVSGFIIEVPCKTRWRNDIFMLSWDTSQHTAEEKVDILREIVDDDGLLFLTELAMEGARLEEKIFIYPSKTESRWVTWDLLPGTLHSILGHFLSPEELFSFELEPAEEGAKPLVGMFLLQSPGREIWKALVWSLREAWRRGHLRKMKLHVLIHHMPDWRQRRWREMLGEARPILGGLHWCYGPNRFDVRERARDNYFHKVFTMLYLARRQEYEYIASFDDDVIMPPSALAYLIDRGPVLGAENGCGVVSPLLNNGVPSVELWAETFLGGDHQFALHDCFGNSGLMWDIAPFDSSELGPMPNPWDANIWYQRVREKARNDYKGVHPVRGNLTCMVRAAHMALLYLEENWYWRDDHRLVKDDDRLYPYLCNNAYVMRTELYGEALERPDLQRTNGADEVPMNLLLNELKLPMCFVDKSYGVHPAYNHHPLAENMEILATRAVMRVINKSSSFVLSEGFDVSRLELYG